LKGVNGQKFRSGGVTLMHDVWAKLYHPHIITITAVLWPVCAAFNYKKLILDK